MQRFELEEGTSSKFWEVEASGTELTVRFGRIGTQGQTKTRTFSDGPAAIKERDKLIKEKTGKGYSEVGVSADAKLAAVTPSQPKADTPEPAAVVAAPSAPSAPPKASPTVPAVTATAAKTPAVAIEWPHGGFQWRAEWRKQLPIVRGINVPPLPTTTLDDEPKLTEEPAGYNYTSTQFVEFVQAAGRNWSYWSTAEALDHVTPAALARADLERWLELYCQLTFRVYSDRAGDWLVRKGLQLHGPAFVLDLTLDYLDLAAGAGSRYTRHDLGLLRHAIAAASDEDYAKVFAVAQRARMRSATTQVACAHLFPHIEDWTTHCIEQKLSDGHLLLKDCVMPASVALAYFKGSPHLHLYYVRSSIFLQIQLHDEAAFDLIALVAVSPQTKDHTIEALQLLTAMHTPRMLQVLVTGIDDQEVRGALDRVAKDYPAAVLAVAIEHSLASRSRTVEGWTVRMALREPAALASALATLSDSERARFEAILAALKVEAAPLDALPPLLRDPPWRHKERPQALPTFERTPIASPDLIDWSDGERAEYLRWQPNGWHLQRAPNDAVGKQKYLLDMLGVAGFAHPRVLETGQVAADDFAPDERYGYRQAEVVALFPEKLQLPLWNSYPPHRYSSYGLPPVARYFLAKHGSAAFPGLLALVQSNAIDGLAIAERIDSQRIVPMALHALRNLKKARAIAADWVRGHVRTTLLAALPQAFSADKAARDHAQYGVRWLAQNGYTDQARAIAAEYGGAMPEALDALLASDPLLVLPTRMPKLPTFFVPASFTRPVLANGGGALPVEALEHIGTMLAISKLDEPYAGVAVVKAACTPDSLAEFAWDLFEAWSGGGAASKEGWAFSALGLLGNDETARRLAPKIREWPGESQHQRAVNGLDVLAAIGSDVALMHLNGIAAKVKFKGLQDKAREKIDAVAEARGFTVDELADRLVPDLGLEDDGSLTLDFGPRQFSVAFDESLRPFVKDAQGARLKDLPKPNKSDDAALAEGSTERYKQMKKDAKAVASLQVIRLELAMIGRRRWPLADFQVFFVGHPLLRHLTARLVWGVYVDGAMQDAFRVAEDWTFANREDCLYTPAADATIGIAHVLEMPAELQTAFGQIFADYEILQPFKQLGRETFRATDAELAASSITRYKDKQVSTGSVMGLVNRGWERGQAQDAGWVGGFTKRVDDLEVELHLDPGTVVGDPTFEPKQKLPSLDLQRPGQSHQKGGPSFAKLDPILLSEVLRDVELLAPIE
jgi:predicted DNA-binding WGR domain protein